MKRRLSRLERSGADHQPPGNHKIILHAPPDDLPDDQYDAWAAEVDTEARRTGNRLVTLDLGPLGDSVNEEGS